MKFNIFTIFLPLGIALGFTFPFSALEMSRWTFVFLLILMLLNFMKIDLIWRDLLSFNKSDFYTIFISYFFMPAFYVIAGHILKLGEPIVIGFFLTNLAPFAIVAPQFLSTADDKKQSMKLVVLSTFLFPFYFILMFYLFYEKAFRLNSISLFKDAFLLISVPLIVSFILKKITKFSAFKNSILRYVPQLNMMIIGILCFIYTGSTFLKNNLSQISVMDFLIIIIFSLIQDFGTLWLAHFIDLKPYQGITLSAKNVALTGIFATVFFPRSIFPIVAVLGIHFLLFNYLFRLNFFKAEKAKIEL